jgi:putative hemolysin
MPKLIERLKSAPAHMLLVYDEYGHFQGIITPMDILGAITGGFDDAALDEPKTTERADGSLLVAGWMPADEFAARLGIAAEDMPDVETAAGLVLARSSELPQIGRRVVIGPWTVEVMDMDGRRIDKLLVTRTP